MDARLPSSDQRRAATDSAVMRCELLSKHFGALKAVDDVSFEVPRGAVLGIGGPNGAGKTTFFDLISGVQAPSSGKIWIRERDMTLRRAEPLLRSGRGDGHFSRMSLSTP